jgi:hypothetical protein
VAGVAFFKTVLKEVGRTSGGRGRRERAFAQLSGVKYKLVSLSGFAFSKTKAGDFGTRNRGKSLLVGSILNCRRQAD